MYFGFTLDNDKYAVHFKHIKIKKSGKVIPVGTECYINKIVADKEVTKATGIVKPLTAIKIHSKDPNDIIKYRNQIKRKIKINDKENLFILKGDSFKYSKGRKYSLKKALESLEFPKIVRKNIWDIFNAKNGIH